MKIYNAFRALPSDKSVYMVCQYISDLIRKFGYDGIKFESSLTTSYNLTIFNCSPDKIQFVDSRIVRAAQLWYSFVDLKNKTIINKNFRDDINDDTFKQANNELSALKRQFCKSKKKNVINS